MEFKRRTCKLFAQCLKHTWTVDEDHSTDNQLRMGQKGSAWASEGWTTQGATAHWQGDNGTDGLPAHSTELPEYEDEVDSDMATWRSDPHGKKAGYWNRKQ